MIQSASVLDIAHGGRIQRAMSGEPRTNYDSAGHQHISQVDK